MGGHEEFAALPPIFSPRQFFMVRDMIAPNRLTVMRPTNGKGCHTRYHNRTVPNPYASSIQSGERHSIELQAIEYPGVWGYPPARHSGPLKIRGQTEAHYSREGCRRDRHASQLAMSS